MPISCCGCILNFLCKGSQQTLLNMGNKLEKLPSRDLKYLRSNTYFDKKVIQDSYKEYLKISPDGLMDLITFKDYLRQFFTEEMDSFAEHYFRVIDKDNSGRIDFREFLLYLSNESDRNVFCRIKLMFDLFDIDGDEKIEKTEMVAMFKIALKMTGEAAEDGLVEKLTNDLFLEYDKGTDYLSYETFKDMFLENKTLFKDFPVLSSLLMAPEPLPGYN